MIDDVRLVGGIELGGTKTIAVVARGRDIVHQERWQTASPDATLGAISAWMAAIAQGEPLAALGVASFGPSGLTPGRPSNAIKLLPTQSTKGAGIQSVAVFSVIPLVRQVTGGLGEEGVEPVQPNREPAHDAVRARDACDNRMPAVAAASSSGSVRQCIGSRRKVAYSQGCRPA